MSCQSFIINKDPSLQPILDSEKSEAKTFLSSSLDRTLYPHDSNLFKSQYQKVYSEALDKSIIQSLMNSLSESNRARLISLSGPYNSLILNSPLAPIRGGRLNPQEFTYFVSSLLGLSNFCQKDAKCCFCHNIMDVKGYHMAICKTGGHVVRRHNALRDLIYSHCQKAAWNPQLEVRLEHATDLIPDIIIPTGNNGKPIALDITVTHPLAAHNIKRASKLLDASNISAEKDKMDKYNLKCSQADIKFIPIAVEHFGRWGPAAMSFFEKLAKGISNRSNQKFRTVLKDLLRCLSFSLVRSNAKAVLNRTQIA